MATHLQVSMQQLLMDRVLDDLKYPLHIVDKTEPFKPPSIKAKHKFDSGAASKAPKTYKRVVSDARADKHQSPWQKDLVKFDDIFQEKLDECIKSKKFATDNNAEWKGPTDTDLKRFKIRGDFELAVGMTRLRVRVTKRPKIKISSPVTSIDNFRVDILVSAELWAKHPALECAKMCEFLGAKFCCWWKYEPAWSKIASLTIEDLDLKADIGITFQNNSAGAIVGKPHFNKLRIDEDFLDNIPLEMPANYFVRDISFTIMDPQDLALDFDSINLHYLPKSVVLPKSTNSLLLDVEFKRV